jgi:NADH-quinone oxidoreductase subunit H
MIFISITILKILSIVVPLLISVAYFTIAERKIMAYVQRRRGPNVIGFMGLLQPLADGLKLFAKETVLPINANLNLFIFSPALSFVLSLIGWSVIPFSKGIVLCNLNLGILYLFTVSALNVYGILLAGWSSNSKYAYLGALRSAAQMISYEISLGFASLNVIICAGSFNLSNIVAAQEKIWFILPLLPIFLIFYISMLAETNRHPFDLPEAEAELVSGYNVEYSGMTFALFFLAEYANMLLMSTFSALMFLGGWLSLPVIDYLLFKVMSAPTWLCLKIIIGALFFILNRASLPRFRYDQLMSLGWKCFLPLTLAYFIFTTGILISFNLLIS